MAVLDLIGSSAKFRKVLDEILMVGPVDCAVLIQGETGTGKEVVARAIHEASPRRPSRFVALNCAAIPSALLESELFGHERGAFTGAVAQTRGRFQDADHGALFLDEIGDLPLDLQPKLLRVLQEKQFERLGGSRTLDVDVRIIAATNQDLWRRVQQGKFRADLYYRLAVFPIILPSLRERIGDIPLLVDHFVRKFAQRQRKSFDTVSAETMEALQSHNWPGNIRELQNVVERAVILAKGPSLDTRIMESITKNSRPVHRTLADAQKADILAALREANWIVAGPRGAATKLGLKRTTLLSRMHRLGIRRGADEQGVGPADRPFVQASSPNSEWRM